VIDYHSVAYRHITGITIFDQIEFSCTIVWPNDNNHNNAFQSFIQGVDSQSLTTYYELSFP
jgi:hypothetical protein